MPAASTTKKVTVQRFEREALAGFVNPQTYLGGAGVELLSVTGSVAVIPYGDIKTVCFVKDFYAADLTRERRLYTSRPKTEGLWVRLRFRDGDAMDGLLPNNLLALDPHGFTLIPPDASANNQRVFIPRQALAEIQVIGVVGSPLRQKKKRGEDRDQMKMFE
jgi:hypothetical protein